MGRQGGPQVRRHLGDDQDVRVDGEQCVAGRAWAPRALAAVTTWPGDTGPRPAASWPMLRCRRPRSLTRPRPGRPGAPDHSDQHHHGEHHEYRQRIATPGTRTESVAQQKPTPRHGRRGQPDQRGRDRFPRAGRGGVAVGTAGLPPRCACRGPCRTPSRRRRRLVAGGASLTKCLQWAIWSTDGVPQSPSGAVRFGPPSPYLRPGRHCASAAPARCARRVHKNFALAATAPAAPGTSATASQDHRGRQRQRAGAVQNRSRHVFVLSRQRRQRYRPAW